MSVDWQIHYLDKLQQKVVKEFLKNEKGKKTTSLLEIKKIYSNSNIPFYDR